MGEISAADADNAIHETHLEFEAVNGFFFQDDPNTDLSVFDMMSENFGLVKQTYDTDNALPNHGKDLSQWQRFAHKLKTMNEESSENESFRLLFLGRHGQGYHNVGESFYGTEAWDCHYSLLDADPKCPEVVFSDAHLTKLGIHQAQTICEFWSRLVTEQSIPLPQTYYVSPLTRAIQTANYTFEFLSKIQVRAEQSSTTSATTEATTTTPVAAAAVAASKPESNPAPYQPQVKELLRENHGVHTCDRRPTKSYLQTTFPNLVFPTQDTDTDTFTETDEIYSPTLREPFAIHARRMTHLLQDILSQDPNTYISMTSHSGTIAATLSAIGHRPFPLPMGGAIPVLIKVVTKPGKPSPFDEHDKTGWKGAPECVSDPSKAGREGYKDIAEYVREIERGVPSVLT